MYRSGILSEQQVFLHCVKWVLNIVIIASGILLVSCAPDVKVAEEKPITATKVKKDKKTPKTKSLSKSRKVISTDIINYRNIDIAFLEELIHKEINKVKKANNLPSLKKNKVLRNAAADQNNYQIEKGDLSHTQEISSKQNLGDRVKYYGGGFQSMAENVMYEGFIVRTTGTKKEIISPSYAVHAKKMVTSWMNSPSHRKNIMNPKFKMVGTAVGYHGGLNVVFATQVFGKMF